MRPLPPAQALPGTPGERNKGTVAQLAFVPPITPHNRDHPNDVFAVRIVEGIRTQSGKFTAKAAQPSTLCSELAEMMIAAQIAQGMNFRSDIQPKCGCGCHSKSRGSLDQRIAGTAPAEFAAHICELRDLIDRFTRAATGWEWKRL
jgi:hypothetical protein